MQHNTRTERFTVYAYQQMMKPYPTTKHGTGFAMVLQGDALHFEIRWNENKVSVEQVSEKEAEMKAEAQSTPYNLWVVIDCFYLG